MKNKWILKIAHYCFWKKRIYISKSFDILTPGCKIVGSLCMSIIAYLENAWNSKQMIIEGEAAIPLETTQRAFGNQSQSKQRPNL